MFCVGRFLDGVDFPLIFDWIVYWGITYRSYNRIKLLNRYP